MTGARHIAPAAPGGPFGARRGASPRPRRSFAMIRHVNRYVMPADAAVLPPPDLRRRPSRWPSPPRLGRSRRRINAVSSRGLLPGAAGAFTVMFRRLAERVRAAYLRTRIETASASYRRVHLTFIQVRLDRSDADESGWGRRASERPASESEGVWIVNNFKNFAIWVALALLVFVLFQIFQGTAQRSQASGIDYSEFMRQVDASGVRDVSLQPQRAAATGSPAISRTARASRRRRPRTRASCRRSARRA